MRVSLAVEDKLFDLGHMNLIEVIRQLDDHDCNQPLLECLAHHPDPCIRIAVSGKQNLSPETVRFLLGVINNPQVQENIMNDHLTSSGMTYEALASLFEGDVDGLSGLARQIDQVRLSNDEVKSLITLLADHPSSIVRMMLAKNIRLPEWALRKLVEDDDELVVQRACRSLALQKAAACNNENESDISSLEPREFSLISNLMLSNYKELEELYSGRYDGSGVAGFHWDEPEGHKTGIDDLDIMTGGMRKGEIILVAGIRNSGTTSLALNIAAGVGIHSEQRDKEDDKVVIFSLKQCEEELSMRMLACESHVNFEQMRLGQFSSEAWRKLAAASGALAESQIHIMHDPDISIYEILVSCKKKMRLPDSIDLVIIDSLDLMNPYADEEKREQEFGVIIEKVRMMADELDCSVLLTVSLPKQITSQQKLRDWSRTLFDGVDTVMQLERRGKSAELKMFKHLTLPASSTRLHFNSGDMSFDSASKNY